MKILIINNEEPEREVCLTCGYNKDYDSKGNWICPNCTQYDKKPKRKAVKVYASDKGIIKTKAK